MTKSSQWQKTYSMAALTFFVTLAIGVIPALAQTEKNWSGTIFAGYNQSSGNTDKATGTLEANAAKAFGDGTLNGMIRLFYSQSDNKMDGQKWETLLKYTEDFGSNNQWFSNFQILADHDRFADIDYRITPAAGLGYHFARTEDWTWNADLSLGYEITNFRTAGLDDEKNLAVIAHTFAKKQVLDNAFLSEDLTIIPGLETGAGVRVKSTTAFTNPLSENLDLEIKLILDYDSEPATGKSSTDRQYVAGIKYRF